MSHSADTSEEERRVVREYVNCLRNPEKGVEYLVSGVWRRGDWWSVADWLLRLPQLPLELLLVLVVELDVVVVVEVVAEVIIRDVVPLRDNFHFLAPDLHESVPEAVVRPVLEVLANLVPRCPILFLQFHKQIVLVDRPGGVGERWVDVVVPALPALSRVPRLHLEGDLLPVSADFFDNARELLILFLGKLVLRLPVLWPVPLAIVI